MTEVERPSEGSVSRRTLLNGAMAGAVVVGFDPGLRGWLTARDPSGGVRDFPDFEGQLLTDDAALAAAADDFGHIVHRRPVAVLRPGSAGDVVKLVRFARRHRIQVAARGQGHSTQGQAQAEAGVVIDMATLDRIGAIGLGSVLVDAGVRMIDLLERTVPLGLTPPVLTDFIELSVGGTLSVGGIGGQAFRHGAQTDNVLELDVVTGRGDLVTCSATRHRALFEACRAGLGQFGVIVRARLRLVGVPSRARVYTLPYGELASFLADQEALVADGRFDYVEGFVLPAADGGWSFLLETGKYFDPGAEPDDGRLLAGLSFIPGGPPPDDRTYFEFADRLAPVVALQRELGTWSYPHPWLNLLVGASEARSFIADALSTIAPADLGEGPILIWAMNRARFGTPFFRVPDSSRMFLFALLRTAVPPTPERAAQLVSDNRRLYDQVVAVGGKRYPIDSVPMDSRDWRRHFEPLWTAFVAAKRRYDPDGILAPGQGIF